ncbi:mitochondrial import inner membrane translocase subunit tim54 [Diatrype stigma]|uniref:Mitochondrial import inner membrane translocase subunit TIM54 n=1 Tax=Diatrype stigma TaxID=117547 RepID=A0AAN9YN67_9PEZI
MADPTPPTQGTAAGAPASTVSTATLTPQAASATYKAPTAQSAAAAAAPPPKPPNPVLRMMGIPGLPKKLPSRNWLIFWAVTGTFTGAIIYDRREKKRATARWARAVAPLATEPLPGPPTQMPRRLTVFLECPPGDGLRVAQDHFTEYVKPVLAASGLDWEFVQGRREGDIRAALAERIRRTRQPPGGPGGAAKEAELQTTEEIIREVRTRNGTPEWQGVRGDIVVGRHTWKEYVRGLHEGWLGPLAAPPPPVLPEPADKAKSDDSAETNPAEKKEEGEKKPERPPQPPPHNTPADYPTASLPTAAPAAFDPSAPIPFPHLLGFSGTFTRLYRFLNRRYLADDVGREVAAVCFAAAREYRPAAEAVHRDDDDSSATATSRSEIESALEHEERDWVKSVWKESEAAKLQQTETEGSPIAPESSAAAAAVKEEKTWTDPVVVDPRIGTRMRRFELRAEDEARARAIRVPEEDVEGWIKGSVRGLWRWATARQPPKPDWADSSSPADE